MRGALYIYIFLNNNNKFTNPIFIFYLSLVNNIHYIFVIFEFYDITKINISTTLYYIYMYIFTKLFRLLSVCPSVPTQTTLDFLLNSTFVCYFIHQARRRSLLFLSSQLTQRVPFHSFIHPTIPQTQKISFLFILKRIN